MLTVPLRARVLLLASCWVLQRDCSHLHTCVLRYSVGLDLLTALVRPIPLTNCNSGTADLQGLGHTIEPGGLDTQQSTVIDCSVESGRHQLLFAGDYVASEAVKPMPCNPLCTTCAARKCSC